MGMKKDQKKKEGKKSEGDQKARQTLGKFGKWLFFFDCGTELDKRQCCSRRTTGRMQQEVQIKKAGEWRNTQKGGSSQKERIERN